MPAVARVGDTCTGHGNFPPRTCDSGSSNVFVNGIAVTRQGDHWVTHSNGDSSHDGTLAGGSGTVYANGKPVARIGDMISCGSAVAKGSGNVFAGS